MKNKTKIMVLILALLMMCVSFSGCAELDQMRKEHAVWTTKGSTDSITYMGNEYIKLPGVNNPTPMGLNVSPVYVTDSGVPVLLSHELSTLMELSEDGNFLTGYVYDDSYYEYSYTSSGTSTREYISSNYVIYCKADIYDDVTTKINEEIEYPYYGYNYFVYDEITGTDEYSYYYLTEEEIDAINTVIKEVEPVTDNNVVNHMWLVSLDKISKNKYFMLESFEIFIDDYNRYYLASYSYTFDEYTIYQVPDEMKNIFDHIVEAANSMNEVWYEEVVE